MISHALVLILQQTLIITAFVLGMMMIIEFINVRTRGLWSKKLQASPWIQILVCAIMGIIPGCLGTYTAVSLYVHRVVNFPALMAALIATTGDESFFMFSLFPRKALIITAILFILSIINPEKRLFLNVSLIIFPFRHSLLLFFHRITYSMKNIYK